MPDSRSFHLLFNNITYYCTIQSWDWHKSECDARKPITSKGPVRVRRAVNWMRAGRLNYKYIVFTVQPGHLRHSNARHTVKPVKLERQGRVVTDVSTIVQTSLVSTSITSW